MRNSNALGALLLLWIAAPCGAQRATVNVNADVGPPHDVRPFGKYLAQICTLSGDNQAPNCVPTTPPSTTPPSKTPPPTTPSGTTPQLIDQTVTLKLACDPAAKGPCNPAYPVVAGTDFFVSATADSGQPVQQTVRSGPATPSGGSGTVHYRANGPGLIVIRASVGATPVFAAPAPVDLLLQVNADPADAAPSCAVLPPAAAPAQSATLDATTIVSLLGNPTPFLLAAQGPNMIAIYSTRQPLHDDEKRILDSLRDSIGLLAGRTATSLGITPAPAKPFTVELAIPHATTLGDLATRVNGLNYSQFTVQDVGSDKVRVTATTQPDCATWTGFLSDIRHMALQVISEPMSTKLYFLGSSDVAGAFSGLGSAATTSSTSSGSGASGGTTSSGSSASGTSGATTPSTSSASGTSGATTPSTSSASGTSGATSSNASITITQPPGSNIQINSDTTPCVVAGLAFGNASACGSSTTSATTAASGAASATSAATPAAKAPLAMASVPVAMGAAEQAPPDLLVFSDTNPGDDAQIQERLRILAQLDLPRPEMIINAWVTQNSSTNPQAMGAFSNMVHGLVSEYDHEFENVVLSSWDSLKAKSAPRSYFNEAFRSYVADRFVADTYQANKPSASVQELSQAFLDNSQAQLADPIAPATRTELEICERGRYCLGYNNLFNPLKPALTDLLLTIIAAQDPIAAVDTAVAAVETNPPPATVTLPLTVADCDKPVGGLAPGAEVKSRCHAIWRNLDLDHVSPPPGGATCADKDLRGILSSLFFNPEEHRARVHLQCFKEEAKLLLKPAPAAGAAATTPGAALPPYGAGLMRAVIADFLFNYKMSQQYPHDFAAYDLSHSADALNTALSPLIDAFNRDLTSYQLFVRADMQHEVERLNSRTDERCCVKRLFGLDKPSFFNDGVISVRTISGQLTSVNTTSQSFLDASAAPQLSALLSSLGGSNTAPAGGNSLASAALTATPLGKAELLAGALANYQSTFAQIGRALNFSVTPRSLGTASSAELAVTLSADESAAPTYTSGGTVGATVNTSRVANHDTATRVRVNSVKLFEVSSFTAIVERSRSRFPLLPPFVEIPYIGTFAGIPLGAAKEFHSSTAILSAYVVPTASDIAYGLRYVSDLLVDGLNSGPCSFYKGAAGPDVTNACLFRKAVSLHDLKQPVSNFNKVMTHCLATDTSSTGCRSVSFNGVPNMY